MVSFVREYQEKNIIKRTVAFLLMKSMVVYCISKKDGLKCNVAYRGMLI